MDAIALLADTWDNELDPEVSAQLVQAYVQAYLSFGKEKGKGKGKGQSKSRYRVRPSHLSLEDRRRLRKLKAKTACRACGRKGHIGCVIANVHGFLPVRLRKTSNVQLV